MEKKTIIQRLKKQDKEPLDKAYRYYSILSAINGLDLTSRQLQLIAFIAVKGTISYDSNKKEFCSLYNSSPATINNIVFELKKKKILIKDSAKIKVNPQILLNFNEDIILQISLTKE